MEPSFAAAVSERGMEIASLSHRTARYIAIANATENISLDSCCSCQNSLPRSGDEA